MTVIVERVDDDVVKVNGKIVIRDMNENWIAHEKHSSPDFKEKLAFRTFLQASELCPNLIKAEYKYGN